MKREKSLEDQYPSVDLAYDLTMKSYDTVIKRNEVQDDGIDKLRTFMTTVTLAAFGFIASRATIVSFHNWWFWFSVVMYFYTIILTVVAKSSGGLIMLSPSTLYEKYLHYSEWEFKKNILYWMAKHSETNRKYIAHKSRLFVIIFAFFLIQILSLLVWMRMVLH
jgi:hypothetical protein